MAQIVQFFLYLVFVLIFILLLLLAARYFEIYFLFGLLLSKFVCMHLVSFFFILFLGVFNFLFFCPVRAAMKNMVKVIVRTYFLARTPVKWHLANGMKRRLPHSEKE